MPPSPSPSPRRRSFSERRPLRSLVLFCFFLFFFAHESRVGWVAGSGFGLTGGDLCSWTHPLKVQCSRSPLRDKKKIPRKKTKKKQKKTRRRRTRQKKGKAPNTSFFALIVDPGRLRLGPAIGVPWAWVVGFVVGGRGVMGRKRFHLSCFVCFVFLYVSEAWVDGRRKEGESA